MKAKGDVRLRDDEVGDLRDVDLHSLLALEGEEVVAVRLLDVVEELGELLAEE